METKQEFETKEQRLIKEGYVVFTEDVLAKAIAEGKKLLVDGYWTHGNSPDTAKHANRMIGKYRTKGDYDTINGKLCLLPKAGLLPPRNSKRYIPWYWIHDAYCKLID